MSNDFKSKGPELLVDLAVHVAETIKELFPENAGRAEEIGQTVVDKMAAHWGGQNIYFPMGLSYRLSRRDLKIYEEFNGTNHAYLARKHHVSLVWVYKIVKAVHAAEIARRQGGLFGDEQVG
jgi:Mor family transcriptional regulator